MKRLVSCFFCVCVALPGMVKADLDTSPYLFTDQASSATGHFEWDEFSSTGMLNPDVTSFGGTGTINALDFEAQPMDGPPFPLITSTQNVYSGGTLVNYDVDLGGLTTDELNTTVVLQVSIIGALDETSILLDGVAPTELIDRGVQADVIHDIDNNASAFDTRFYWAEWQVGAETNYEIRFKNLATHQSLAQVRVEYFNTASTFDAFGASAVPEPGTAGVCVLAFAGLFIARRKRRS